MGLQVFDEHDVYWNIIDFTAADGTTPKALVLCIPAQMRIDSVIVTSTSAADHDVKLCFNSSGLQILVTATVPAGAGTVGGIPPVDVVASLPATLDHIRLISGDHVYAAPLVVMGAAEWLTIIAYGGQV